MATVITINTSIEFNDGFQDVTAEAANLTVTPSTSRKADIEQLVPTTAGGTAVNLGGLPSLGWCTFINTDPTNYVQLLTGSAGKVVARLPAGGFPVLLYCDSDMQAPYLLANTASCLVRCFLTAQ